MTGGWITQADRSRWQQRAAAELAAILDAHPDIPVIAWTVDRGRSVPCRPGQRPVPAAQAGGCSGNGGRHWAWTSVTETPSAGGTPVYLHARGVRGGVTVSVTATVFDDEEDGR